MRGLVTLGGIAVSLALGAGTAAAATITPTTFADEFNTNPSACSVREAVQAANSDATFGGCPSGGGTDTIPLRPGTYKLAIPPDGSPDDNADGDLDVTGFVWIQGKHEGLAALDGGEVDRVLHVLGAARLDLTEVAVQNGRAALSGGGIFNGGTLSVSRSIIRDNTALGSFGGGIASGVGATTNLMSVTLAGNSVNQDGGGYSNGNMATATLENVTAVGNTADADDTDDGGGGGISRFGGTVTMSNSLIAGNLDPSPGTIDAPDCFLTSEVSGGNNLIGDNGDCYAALAPTDLTGVDPMLGPLANNGGPTPSFALLPGSPAINGGRDLWRAFNDQRGVPRWGVPDIGAYELVRCGGVIVNRVGTPGRDLLTGTKRADGLFGLGGPDVLRGQKGRDALCGGGSKDVLRGGRGNDFLKGASGADLLIGNAGKDRCKGGSGNDTLRSCER